MADDRIRPYMAVKLPAYGFDLGQPYDLYGDPAGPMRPVKRLSQGTLGRKPGDARLTRRLPDIPITTP
jgi:hypothetical protein